MKKILSFVIQTTLFSFLMGGVALASCNSKAQSVAAQRGAKVLSVKAVGSSCRIRLLVSSGGGAPKRITVTVPK
ncbi:MAG: hypothetical protein AAFO61_06680 [Pseudomonadota bacterium]